MPTKEKQLTHHQRAALQSLKNNPSQYVIGIDEVGLGAWAGPLAIGAAVTLRDWSDPGVRDSKMYSSTSARERALRERVLPNTVFHAVLMMDAPELDKVGADAARIQLTESAAIMCRVRFPDAPVVLDGNRPIYVDGSLDNVVILPKADQLVTAVSAASIIAKTRRDQLMVTLASTYPHWNFEGNKGYHSSTHVAGLQAHGVCPLHRMSYRPIERLVAGHTDW